MSDMDMILDHLKHMEVDMFIFPETNLDTHKNRVKRQVHNHCRKSLGQGTYQIEMTTSNAEYTGQYKPGGIMGGVIGRNKARILESGHDKFGRWIYFRMSGQGHKVYGPIPYSPELMRMKMVDKVINMIVKRM
jgi:hypothetical protein